MFQKIEEAIHSKETALKFKSQLLMFFSKQAEKGKRFNAFHALPGAGATKGDLHPPLDRILQFAYSFQPCKTGRTVVGVFDVLTLSPN